jgi:hypothetical protein
MNLLKFRRVLPFLTLGLVAHSSLFATQPAPAAAERETLIRAVAERRVVTFLYQGHPRVVEPHACGIATATGEAVLHGFQTGGGSTSGALPAWRTFSVAKITSLVATGERFAEARPGYVAQRPPLDPVWAELPAE